jgi:hypothetical protein
MAIATRPERQTVTTEAKFPATTEQVWREIEKASFAVCRLHHSSGRGKVKWGRLQDGG